MGALGCFSFFPSKNLGAFGDGGLVTTDDEALAREVRLLRNHGAEPKYFHQADRRQLPARRAAGRGAAGQAAAPRAVDAMRARQRRALRRAVRTSAGLGDRVALPVEVPGCTHIFNQFVIRVAGSRSRARAPRPTRGIGTEIYYPVPFHLQECFAASATRGGFPARRSARPTRRSRCRSTAS